MTGAPGRRDRRAFRRRRLRGRVAALAPQASAAVPWAWFARLVRSADLGIAPEDALRRAAWLLAGAAAAGAMIAGFPGLVGGPALAGAGGIAWLRRRASGRLRRLAASFPDMLRGMSDALRSGMSLAQAVEMAAEEAAPPLGAEIREVVRECSVGTPLEHAVASFADRCPVPGADLLTLAVSVAARSGADLAPILDGIVDAARDRERLHGELRAATAQGRLTATVVASLPVAFLVIMGAGARAELHLLIGEPVGWALLAVGGLLQLAGFLWIRKLAR